MTLTVPHKTGVRLCVPRFSVVWIGLKFRSVPPYQWDPSILFCWWIRHRWKQCIGCLREVLSFLPGMLVSVSRRLSWWLHQLTFLFHMFQENGTKRWMHWQNNGVQYWTSGWKSIISILLFITCVMPQQTAFTVLHNFLTKLLYCN